MLLNILSYAPTSPLTTNPLQDAGWIGVGVAIIIGIATVVTTVVITIWAVRKQRNKKEIMYQVVSDAPVISIDKAVQDKVEVRLSGIVVHNARLLVLKLWNSGDVAVKRDDYDEPITVEFPERGIVSSEVFETQPKNLIDPKLIKTFLKSQHKSMEISKFLLNPKESITLAILTDGEQDKINIRGRIIDGDIVEFIPEDLSKIISMYSTILFALTVTTILIGILVISNLINKAPIDISFIIAYLVFFIIAFITSITFDIKNAHTIKGLKFKWKK